MSRQILKITLVGYVGLLLYGGLMPLEFRYDRAAWTAEWGRAVHAREIEWGHILHRGDARRNVLLFVPGGVLLALVTSGRRRWWWTVSASVLLSGGVSLAIEAGQLFVPMRIADIRDMATNVVGGAAGAVLVIASAPLLRPLGGKLSARLKGRYGALAAAALAAGLMATTAWRLEPTGDGIGRQGAAVIWSLREGLAVWPWHKWLIRCVAPYAALTLLLTASGGSEPVGRRRAWLTAAAAVGLAGLIQAMGLLTSGPPPNVAYVLMAAVGAALAAPTVRGWHVELPAAVLACAVGMVALAAHLVWLSSSSGWAPLWGLYQHEGAWGYYSTSRRWAAMAGVSFLLAFYLSVTQPWRLRYRMGLGLLLAALCACAAELAKLALRSGPMNGAGLIEHVVAAGAGVLAFGLLWRLLDRRDGQPVPAGYAGRERRRSPEPGPGSRP